MGGKKSEVGDTLTQRKHLMLSSSKKEKLLKWDMLVTTDNAPIDTSNTQHKEKEKIIKVALSVERTCT